MCFYLYILSIFLVCTYCNTDDFYSAIVSAALTEIGAAKPTDSFSYEAIIEKTFGVLTVSIEPPKCNNRKFRYIIRMA